jgi:hypothetical protein
MIIPSNSRINLNKIPLWNKIKGKLSNLLYFASNLFDNNSKKERSKALNKFKKMGNAMRGLQRLQTNEVKPIDTPVTLNKHNFSKKQLE